MNFLGYVWLACIIITFINFRITKDYSGEKAISNAYFLILIWGATIVLTLGKLAEILFKG